MDGMTTHPSSTWLTAERYLELLRREGELLLSVAESSMHLSVPTCPGWTVDDVVFHTGSVYAHKVSSLRLGRRAGEGESSAPPDDADFDADLAWCHAMLHEVAAELAARPPEAPAMPWGDEPKTVAFWQRRMALETAVHRADVEAAKGVITPIDADLALDGIDEVLHVMLTGAGVTTVDGPIVDGERVLVTNSGTSVSGGASDLLLWLWGRAGDHAVMVAGDANAAADLRRALQAATQ